MTGCHCDHRTCFPCYRQGGSLKEETMPHFRKGYDERLDLTEDEYLERLAYDSEGEEDYEPFVVRLRDEDPQAKLWRWAQGEDIEGEPYEDTYLPGIPDYDRFGRPSWEVEE